MKTMQNNAIYNNLALLEILDEAAISEQARNYKPQKSNKNSKRPQRVKE